jgi:hypothetical protein
MTSSRSLKGIIGLVRAQFSEGFVAEEVKLSLAFRNLVS